MKLLTTDSELWFIAHTDDIRPVRGLTIRDLLEKIIARFGFMGLPNAIPERDQGYILREGSLKTEGSSIRILRLELYNDGIHVVVSSTTDDADLVFSELRKILIEIGGPSDIRTQLSYHVSTIVCQFDNSIDHMISGFQEISKFISPRLDVPGEVHSRLISFLAEPPTHSKKATEVNPTLFRIEPRIGTQLGEKRYFSMANMTTRNHLETLDWLDRHLGMR